ncbi:double zinc ribbon domain-containing protein [Paenibacillus marinisediminis]
MNSKTLFIIVTTFVSMMVAGIGFIGTLGLLHEGNPLLLYIFFGFMIFIVLIGCFVGRYVYLDARSRGMNVWLWTLIAMYIPIGLLLYVIVRNPVGAYAAGQYGPNGLDAGMRPQTMHACQTCSHMMLDTFEYCPNCGDKQHIQCPSCHAAVLAGWMYCPSCGKRMPDSASRNR